MIELMVALVLGLVLLGGVISIFTTSQRSYLVNENLSRIQENSRFSFETLVREVREAGNVPCGNRAMANVVRVSGAGPWWADWAAGTVRGFDGAQDSSMAAFGSTTAARVSATDGVIIMRTVSDESAVKLVSAHDAGAATFTVPAAAGITQADIVVACDPKSAALLEVGTTSGTTIGYAAPANCSINLGYPTGLCDGATPSKTFDPGAIVAKFDPAFWYIGVNSRGTRSLYRLQLTKTGTAGSEVPSMAAQEMVPGVHDMQIEYLTRNATTGVSTSWITAADTTFTTGNGWTEANVNQAIAIRITLTLRSEDNVSSAGTPIERKFVTVASLRSKDL